MTEEQAKLLQKFRKRSLNIDQIRAKWDLDDYKVDKVLNELMDEGLIIGIPSRSTGIMVYYLMTILPGLIEYPFMRGEKGQKQKRLAKLVDKYLDSLGHMIQSNYDLSVKQLKKGIAFDRVVPVEKEIPIQQEVVLPYEGIESIIEKQEVISNNQCFCRNWKELLNEPCKLNPPKFTCMSFGLVANFLIDHNFGKPISKEEAIEILKDAEDIGLVHKVVHVQQNPEQEEQSICNCCSCCCALFQGYQKGLAAFHTLTSYIADVDITKCKGCGICVEKCPIEAIELINSLSVTNIDSCIGCGICAHFCSENARCLRRTGLREVFIPPPKIDKDDLKLIQT
jgi:NAD-dependent dihydropyrimidine dehydrogenase PreA subunit